MNKQIIKALSVGISASMLLQPVSAMAAEIDTPAPTPVTEEKEEANSTSDYVAAEATAVSADEAVETAIEASHDVINEVEADKADVTAEVIAASVSYNEVLASTEEELAKNCDDAKADVSGMDDQASIIAAATVSGNNAAVSANDAADDVSANAIAGAQIADAAYQAVKDVSDNLPAKEKALEEADTTEEAVAIYSEILKDVSGADYAVEKAAKDFAEVEKAYNAAKDVYTEKQAAYAAAQSALNNAINEFNSLKAAGLGETVDAQTSLDLLYAEAERLEAETQSAYDEFVKAGYGLIALREKEAGDYVGGKKEMTNAMWPRLLDPLFDAVIRYYYVPDMLEGTEVKSAVWTKFDDDSLNYCTLVYVDKDGQEKTQILNYRLANSNKNEGFVIFEKTAYLVYSETDFNEDEIAALKGGDVVYKDGYAVVYNADNDQYVVYNANEETAVPVKSATLVEEANVDIDLADVTENTEIVDIADKEEVSYQYDVSTGNVVKVVTAEVTRTTFTGKSLSASEVNNDTEDAAKAAYAAEIKRIIREELEEGESIVIAGKEYSLENIDDVDTDLPGYESVKQASGYNVSGTYCEKFTKTVPVSGSVSGRFYAPSDEYVESVYEQAALAIGEETAEDYEFGRVYWSWRNGLSVQREFTYVDTTVEEATITNGRRNTKNYSGAVSVSYAQVSSMTVSEDWLFLKFFDIDEDKIEAQFKAEGKEYLGMRLVDGTLNQYTIYYVDAKKAENVTVEATNETEALAAFKEANGGKTYNEQLTFEANYKYGYAELAYFIQKVNKNTEIISTSEWAEILGNANLEYRNDKFDQGDIILAEYDYTDKRDYVTDAGEDKNLTEEQAAQTADFRNKVDNAARIANEYQEILKKAKSAEEAIAEAKRRVAVLNEQIDALLARGQLDGLKALEGDLKDAKEKLEKAIKIKEELDEKLDEIEEKLEEKIEELTEEEEEEEQPIVNPGGPSEEQPSNPTNEEEIPFVPSAPLDNIVFETTPIAPTPAVVADIPDDDVALADAPEVKEEPEVADVKDDDVALAAAPVTVTDDATPLASLPEEGQMSWWWLLIVLILGATGAEMYRRHMAKKKAMEITTTDTNK
ncbi:MAG: hypothetical protein J5626_00090 [Lachnospiraceae bacterium]|nr:hypothetical protein [Lachnospiraceae bacterium]